MAIFTTYQYKPLQSNRHIRLLDIHGLNVARLLRKCNSTTRPAERTHSSSRGFSFIHTSVDDEFRYDTVSYAWGDCTRVAGLPIAKGQGHIALTQSLVDALPYLSRQSRTGFLWIDQICINQDDTQERDEQVALMGDVYRGSTRTLIWLGLDSHSGQLVREIVMAIRESDIQAPGHTITRRRQLESLIRRPNWRFATSEYVEVAAQIASCSWITRGWVVQEYVLSRLPFFLLGNHAFCAEEFGDFIDLFLDEIVTTAHHINYILLIGTKLRIDNLPRPFSFLDWFSRMCYCAGYLETTIERDGLFAFLGLWKPPSFQPSYLEPLEDVYRDFALCISRDLGSLDFLSINQPYGSTDSRPFRESSCAQLPTWVPDWSKLALRAPSSILGDVDFSFKVPWSASNGRTHTFVKVQIPNHLKARGKVIDRINLVCPEPPSYLSAESTLAYLETSACKLSRFHQTANWTVRALVAMVQAFADIEGASEDLTLLERLDHPSIRKRLHSRVIVLTQNGRIGLAPLWCGGGHLVAIIHGCSVPLLLSKDENKATYSLVGDCYLEGIMYGEAVTWEADEADEIVLE